MMNCRMTKEDMSLIYIIRHGQTAKNKAKVLQGRSDIPLNEEGKRQAEAVKESFEKKGIKLYHDP